MALLFSSDSDNEEISPIAQQLQGSDDVRAALVDLVLVNQFKPSSGPGRAIDELGD